MITALIDYESLCGHEHLLCKKNDILSGLSSVFILSRSASLFVEPVADPHPLKGFASVSVRVCLLTLNKVKSWRAPLGFM